MTLEEPEALGTPIAEVLATLARSIAIPKEAKSSATTLEEAKVPFDLIGTTDLSSLMSWSADLPALNI